jgi:hypothetical protein
MSAHAIALLMCVFPAPEYSTEGVIIEARFYDVDGKPWTRFKAIAQPDEVRAEIVLIDERLKRPVKVFIPSTAMLLVLNAVWQPVSIPGAGITHFLAPGVYVDVLKRRAVNRGMEYRVEVKERPPEK